MKDRHYEGIMKGMLIAITILASMLVCQLAKAETDCAVINYRTDEGLTSQINKILAVKDTVVVADTGWYCREDSTSGYYLFDGRAVFILDVDDDYDRKRFVDIAPDTTICIYEWHRIISRELHSVVLMPDDKEQVITYTNGEVNISWMIEAIQEEDRPWHKVLLNWEKVEK